MAEGSSSIEIPVEIAAEIIERLPLKSLARFKCASKLWSSLVRETISRRWREEMCRRLHRLDEIYRSLMSLHDTVKGLRCDADDLHEHGDRLRGNLDEIRSLAACNDDIDRYQEKGAAFDMLRDCVDRATNYCNWLLVLVDGLVEIDGKVKKIAAQGLNLRNIYNSFNLN